MPKDLTHKKEKRHSRMKRAPLDREIAEAENPGYLKAPKRQRAHEEADDDLVEESVVPQELSKRILQQAQQQQEEEQVKPQGLSSSSSGSSSSGAGAGAGGGLASQPRKQQRPLIKLGDAASDDEDVDQDGEELEEIELDDEEQKALALFAPTTEGATRTLADLIMSKIQEKQGEQKAMNPDDIKSALDPKIIEVYTKVGHYLHNYTSGKIPKAFKIVPSLKNWEEVVYLTHPEDWSAQATAAATRLFASNLKPKAAQRFYNLVLLPRVKSDISKNKKLNYHLYQALKKAMYKPAAFFKGILLPMAEFGCTVREAIIMSSVLNHTSVPVVHASVALLKMAEMPYSGPTTLFMKTLLDKKYSLPYKVIHGLVKYFCQFSEDERKLPVIFHQNLYAFMQRYKMELTEGEREDIKRLLRTHVHPLITPEVRRELAAAAAAAGGSGATGGVSGATSMALG